MSKAGGVGRHRGKGKGGQAMEREEMAIGGHDPAMRQVAAEETVHASASVTALGGQAPTGIGSPLRASWPGDGQHWVPTLRVAMSRCSIRQLRDCPQGEGCCNKYKFAIPQRRIEAAPPQQLWFPVRPAPIDRHMRTIKSPPSQPTPIHLQLIVI